jgi:hypothetical protein
MALHWVKMAKVQWEWGRLMRAYRIQKRKTATRHGSKKNSLQTHKRSSKTNLVKTFSFLTLVLLLSSSLLVIGSVGYGQQQDPIISGDENTGQYTATWTFDNSSKFTTTQTEIATSQVTLQSDNYNWTQSTKNDFDLGKHDNITVLTSSEAEIIKEEDFENGTGGWQHGILDGQVDDWQYGQISQVPEFIRVGSPSFAISKKMTGVELRFPLTVEFHGKIYHIQDTQAGLRLLIIRCTTSSVLQVTAADGLRRKLTFPILTGKTKFSSDSALPPMARWLIGDGTSMILR